MNIRVHAFLLTVKALNLNFYNKYCENLKY